MCNIGKGLSRALGIGTVVDMTTSALSRAITPPGTGGLEAAAEAAAAAAARQNQLAIEAQQRTAAAQEEQANIARQSAATALEAQNKAAAQAAAAATPAADNESAVRANDERLRKLISSNSFGVKGGKSFGAPPVGYRVLTGS